MLLNLKYGDFGRFIYLNIHNADYRSYDTTLFVCFQIAKSSSKTGLSAVPSSEGIHSRIQNKK